MAKQLPILLNSYMYVCINGVYIRPNVGCSVGHSCALQSSVTVLCQSSRRSLSLYRRLRSLSTGVIAAVWVLKSERVLISESIEATPINFFFFFLYREKSKNKTRKCIVNAFKNRNKTSR